MKENFKLVTKLHGYAISNICDPAVKVAMHILAGKMMRKFHADEVSTLVVTLADQRTKGI